MVEPISSEGHRPRNVLEGTPLGDELIARGEIRGRALHGLLVLRFGDVDGIDRIAEALAADPDVAASVRRVSAALIDLVS